MTQEPGLLTRGKSVGSQRRSPARPPDRSGCARRRVLGAGLTKEIVLTPLATSVLNERYLRKDENGHVVETPEEMFWRGASHVAQAGREYGPEAHEWAERFFRTMASLDLLPNSPCLMNAGRELAQLGACFVLPVRDSLDDIFTTLREAALINKSGGGTGFSFSRLRPKDNVVASTGGVAACPVRFMRVFNAASAEIKQGGRRHAANMAVLRVDHPDILDFIKAKSEPGVLEQFNIPVAVTDDFMLKVAMGGEYETTNPRTGEPAGRLRARGVWLRIAQQAWKTGEPGVISEIVNHTVSPPAQVPSSRGAGSGPPMPDPFAATPSLRSRARTVPVHSPSDSRLSRTSAVCG